MINCNTGRRTAISDRMKLHDSKKCLCVIMIQMGLFQFIPCVASMLFYVACGNGLARRIMTAKGGFCHVKRKHQDIKKSKGSFPRGTRSQTECGQTDDFQMGARGFT